MPIRLDQWLSYLVLGCLLLYVLARFRPEIAAGLRSLWRWLAGFRLKAPSFRFGRKSRTASQTDEPNKVGLLSNPFHNGQAARMSVPELVRYSFDGLTRWAQARGFVLEPSETPIELAERLSAREPVMTHQILLVSSYYSHVIYGDQSPPDECRDVLRSLWSVIGFEK